MALAILATLTCGTPSVGLSGSLRDTKSIPIGYANATAIRLLRRSGAEGRDQSDYLLSNWRHVNFLVSEMSGGGDGPDVEPSPPARHPNYLFLLEI